MGFWQRLKGRGNRPPETHEDRRGSVRFAVSLAPGVDGFTVEVGGLHYPVYDLSRRGMCLEVGPDGAGFAPGDRVDGLFRGGTVAEPLAVQLDVVSALGYGFVGCRVRDPDEAWMAHIVEVLDPYRLGRGLKEIDPALLYKPKDLGTVRWFYGGAGCELHAAYDGDALVDVQLYFGWRMLEWSREHGVRTGRIERPPRGETAEATPSAHMFELIEPPDLGILADGRRLLSVAPVPEEVRSAFAPPTEEGDE